MWGRRVLKHCWWVWWKMGTLGLEVKVKEKVVEEGLGEQREVENLLQVEMVGGGFFC